MSRHVLSPDELRIVDESFERCWALLSRDVGNCDQQMARAHLARIVMSMVIDEEVQGSELVERSIARFRWSALGGRKVFSEAARISN